MALVLKDRVKETTTTTGTGTYTLAGAVTGFEAFSEIGNSNTTYYCCTDGTDFEVGIGTYTASGTTLARTTILQSSNSDNAVNWSSGSRTIFCTQPAEKAVFLNADGDIDFENTATRIKLESNAGNSGSGDPSISIAGGGPNYIRFHDGTDFTSATNAVDIVYRTSPNDLLIERASGENIAEFGGDDGHAALYFNNSKKLETVSGGITVTGEIAATSLDISGDVDVDGTLEADAMTLNGTAITTTATLSTGISNNNVPKFTSGVADNDFLRVNGTAIEGRSASEVLSDIGAATSAQGSTADSAMQDLSDDTTPQLGGNLDLNSKAITGTGHLEPVAGTTYTPPSGSGSDTSTDVALALRRDDHIVVGHNGYVRRLLHANSSGDIHIGHSTTTGLLGNVKIYPGSGGSTEIYHKGTNLKIDTTDAGIDVTGNITVSGTVDGRDLATDGTKLDGIASSATANPNALDNVSEDTTPQLGGVLDTNGNNIEFPDSSGAEVNRLKFGAGDDLQIFHDGSNSVIADVGTGNLVIAANDFQLTNQAITENLLKAFSNGAVELYHDNSKKLETASGGISVTGEVAATSLDISGDVDVDGTLEADAITVNGTALASSATTDTTDASNITSGTLPNARLDAQLQDVAGLAVTNGGFIVGDGSNFVLETGATARTSLGLGTAAVAATGISNGNVPVFTSGVADDDFLRVNGTSIEGRSASELASDIGAATTDDATALAIALG